MTLAQILTDIRNLIGEESTDAGALLSDTGNMLTFVSDAQEQTVLDLMSFMPSAFLGSENVSLVAGTANYALTGPLWQVWKVERNVTGESPLEIKIIDPSEIQYHMYTGDTAADPTGCYFIGDSIYFVPTPSTSVTNYAKVWMIKPEAATMATGGPALIPAVAHRLIVYQTCSLIATLLERDPSPYMALYARRLQMVNRVWAGRFQSQTRHVRPASGERQGIIRNSEDNDVGW
jgi:hypothetical protein